jgi:hypothetical protein
MLIWSTNSYEVELKRRTDYIAEFVIHDVCSREMSTNKKIGDHFFFEYLVFQERIIR